MLGESDSVHMECIVVGREKEGVIRFMEDFAECAELNVLDAPEPYLEEAMQLYIGERLGEMASFRGGKDLLARRLI